MPETTQKELIVIEVSGEQAQSALNKLLESFKRIEDAVVGLGQKFDAAMKQMVQPINNLTLAVDKLDTSIGTLNANLGKGAGLSLLGQQAKQAQIDLADLDRTLERYRVGATKGYREPATGMFQSREQMVERYMLGQFGGGGLAEMGPAPSPTAAPGTTALTYRNVEALQKQLGLTTEQTAAIQQQIAAEGKLIVTIEQLSGAEEQLAASTGRAIAEQLRQQANWEQMVVSGARVAEQLRQQATELMRRGGAGVAERYKEGPPKTIGQVYQRAGWTTGETRGKGWEPPVLPGDPEKELEQIRVLEAAIGRKLVVQKLMARGAQDVAEKFERQFAVTRSKEEILREISRTGKMTTEMEKELGLQTERTGSQARRAGGMFRYFGRYLLRYLVLWQGIQAVRGVSKAWFAAHLEMADAVADFGWRVNATAEDVARYREKLRDVSTLVGMPVGEITSPLAGKATEAELLRAAEAAKVFGGSVEDWLRTLAKGDVTLDAFAHGLRISTLATEDYAKLVGNADDIAKEFNITQAEAIGLLSSLPAVLQTDAEGAAELTEALAGLYEQNQLLMTLGVAPAVTVGPGGAPQRQPMPEVMAGISRLPIERQRQLAIAIGLTGEAQQRLFLDAIAGWSEVQQAINGTVGATGDFEEAMAGADESMKAHVESMKTAWSSLLETIGDTGVAKGAVNRLAEYFKGLTVAIEEPIRALEFLLQVLEAATPGEMLAMLAMGPMMGPALITGLGRVGEAETRAGIEPGEPGGVPGEPRGAGVPPPAPGGPTGPPPAYFPPMPTLRMGEGVGIGQLAAEMERVIDEVFTRPYTTASGEVIQVTKEQIDALRKNTVILDETGEAIGLLNVYAPALAVAQENLKTEVARFNLERLKDVTPEQFDTAMRTTLPMWEARLGAIPGFEEKKELQTFFVGEQDVLRQQLSTQTAMQYTLQDILDVEKDQLEGMWNIPTGVTMRVPLQSLDLMRWMKGAGGGEMPTDMMPTGLDAAVNAQDNAAMAQMVAAQAQTLAAQAMTGFSQGIHAEPVAGADGRVRPEAPLRQEINRGPGQPRGGAAGRVAPVVPVGTTGVGALTPLTAQFVINLVSTLLLDGKVVAEAVQTELARKLVNTQRASASGGAHLRP